MNIFQSQNNAYICTFVKKPDGYSPYITVTEKGEAVLVHEQLADITNEAPVGEKGQLSFVPERIGSFLSAFASETEVERQD